MNDFKFYIILTIIAFICILGIGYLEDKKETIPVTESNVQEEKATGNYKVVRFDSCQYIVKTVEPSLSYRGFGYMAHKGNCDNPIHKH